MAATATRLQDDVKIGKIFENGEKLGEGGDWRTQMETLRRTVALQVKEHPSTAPKKKR
jgi:hypothetical protein